MLSFIPSIALIAHFYGTPGRDKWHPIEKIGIPINIFASILILFIAFYPKDLGAITETVSIEDELGHTIKRVIPKAEYRKKISIFNFQNLSRDEEKEWIKIGLQRGIIIDHADELITKMSKGEYHYLANEKGYKPNDELPLNLMLDIAKQLKTKYLLYGDYTLDDSTYNVSTYLYDASASQLLQERSYKNISLFSIIDYISSDLKFDTGIPDQYIKISKDLPFHEICTKSLNAYREYCKARYARNIDLYIKADDHLNKALEYDPKFAFAYRQLLYNGYALNKEFSQLEHYSNMVLHTMHNVPEYYQRDAIISHAREFDKDINKVRMILEMNIKLNPDDLENREVMYWFYLNNLEFEKAKSVMDYCYAEDPDAKYLRSLGQLFVFTRQYNKGIKYIEEYMNKFPNDDLGYFDASKLYKLIGDYKKAREYMMQCLIVDPEYMDGQCEVEYYNYALKEISFDKLIEKYYNKINRSQTNQDKYLVHVYLRSLYSIHGLIDSAIYHHELSLKLIEDESSPSNIIWEKLTFIPFYLNMGRDELAQKVYAQYGDIGFIKEYELSKAWIYLNENKYDEAQNFTDDAIMKLSEKGQMSRLGQLYFIKGMIYLKLKDYESAITAFEKVLTLPITYIAPYHGMLRTHDFYIYLLLSQASFQLQDIKSARDCIEIAYRLNSFEPRIQYQMALIEHVSGNREKAMEYLEYCLRIWKDADEDYPPALEAKQKLTEWNQVY